MAKIKIDKYDHLRVMLTETLPYEVPITFLNEGLYFYLRDLGNRKKKDYNPTVYDRFLKNFFDYGEYTKPYNYRINKNSISKRLLSVPHPSIQNKITEFYRDYDSLITELCSKSPISLRAPHRVASRFYEKELVDLSAGCELGKAESVETESEAFEQTSKFASSYFTYKKYNFLYKFYDSYESHRIEKKFEHLTRFDISKCFHNIYTPTLAWAVKSKPFAKKHNVSYSFEHRFQTIMQNANYLESSGIIVGPEFSRIYAEIILQELDLNIIDRVKSELGFSFGSDYTLRRYVDDYFLYTQNDSQSSDILILVKDELEKYKLFINESKTEYWTVPFITGLTIAKMDCKSLVRDVFNSFEKNDQESSEDKINIRLNSPSRESNRFIKNLKKIVKVNDVNYESLSGYTLAEIRRRLFRLLENDSVIESIKENDANEIKKVILLAIEVSFFVYSMDIRVRTTYIITQLIVRLNNLTKFRVAEFKDEIRKKIYDESKLLLSKMVVKGKANSIETLNLLIGIRTNLEEYPINEEMILDLFNLRYLDENKIGFVNKNQDLGYFQIMVLVGFIRHSNPKIVKFLESYIFERLTKSEEIKVDTELTCLAFDVLSCPYFSELFKKELFELLCKEVNFESNSSEVFNMVCDKEWFFTWKDNNLAQVLMKKDLRSPY
ncbi:RNA-directed DNA polymerase [Psychrobium sp. MM17-31]|uniref:antiviral reverse transcriptase Drt3b n=1 Tax=Psychrobium sp. MM17-31 TaxID=2917758 RepID=UPI001EF48E52|nr:antiviral reverse transcriptase Drt3b [Psychrobium sp. MM17-31]MCG7531772.1 RNA-directed DNA polymerase [Psychrobium sp. MM17-31]